MWQQINNSLQKEFTFRDFSEAFAFMTRVAMIAETRNHHPTWTNTYNKVHITLQTHDANNSITPKDKELAKAIDEVYES